MPTAQSNQPYNPLEDFDFLNTKQDKDRIAHLQENRKQKKLLRQDENTLKYTISSGVDDASNDNIPIDWSFKNWTDI